MIFSISTSGGGTNGVAALAIVKILLQIMETKKLLSKEEIDILLNMAEVEVDHTDVGGRVAEAKFLISNLMKESDDTTRGFNGSTG